MKNPELAGALKRFGNYTELARALGIDRRTVARWDTKNRLTRMQSLAVFAACALQKRKNPYQMEHSPL